MTAGIKRLFWDIETSPGLYYSWRCGYKINISSDNIVREPAIICISYKWGHEDGVHSIAWADGDDKPVVEAFAKIANEADELVAHNGDKFDLRWFNGRNLVHHLPPVPRYKTVDTLTIARKYFRLQSNRLDYLAKRLLGEGKIKTEFDLWMRAVGYPPAKDDLRATLALTRDPVSLDYMIKYCEMDVTLVERIFNEVSSYDTPKTHVGALAGLGRWTCPHCGSEEVHLSKTRATPKGMIQRQMKCNQCNRYFTIANKVYRDYEVAKYRGGDDA